MYDSRDAVHPSAKILYVSEHLTPLEKSVIALGEGLQHIQAEQEYMKMRERVHRNSEHPSPQNAALPLFLQAT